MFDNVGYKGVYLSYEKDGKMTQITSSEDFRKSSFWPVVNMKFNNFSAGNLEFLKGATFNSGKKPSQERLDQYNLGFIKERHVEEAFIGLPASIFPMKVMDLHQEVGKSAKFNANA